MSKLDSNRKGGGYVQIFVYKLPNKNRGALQNLLKEIAEKLREHGTLGSEFYQLYSREAFQGFTTMASTFASLPEEELWVELDHYKGRRPRDQVMADLSKDSSVSALFRQLGPLVSTGYSIVMGEFEMMAL